MTLPILLSLIVVVITISIHAIGCAWGLNFMTRRLAGVKSNFNVVLSLRILSLTAVFLMLLHFIEIMIWAMIYCNVDELKGLFEFEKAVYFSTVTYTTTGYGDITLPPQWRLMSGFEAMSGILLFGWTTAMFYAVVQKITARIKAGNH